MVIPNNTPNPYTFRLSQVQPRKTPGGSVKVVDSRTFKVATKISAVEVVVEVGGMRYVAKLMYSLPRSQRIYSENFTYAIFCVILNN